MLGGEPGDQLGVEPGGELVGEVRRGLGGELVGEAGQGRLGPCCRVSALLRQRVPSLQIPLLFLEFTAHA